MEIINAQDLLSKAVRVIMDRPLGTRHPRCGFLYPVNYGFVPHTLSPDGAELDAYVLGVSGPLARFEGECIAVIHRLNDADDKLIVVPTGQECTDEEIRRATEFQERFFESLILREALSEAAE